MPLLIVILCFFAISFILRLFRPLFSKSVYYNHLGMHPEEGVFGNRGLKLMTCMVLIAVNGLLLLFGLIALLAALHH